MRYLIILILFAGCTLTPDKWSAQDYAMQSLVVGTKAVDWLQTKEIARNDDYYERNPILGENPSQTEVNLFFLAGSILETGAVHFTKSEYRPYVQTIFIGVNSAFVIHNYSIGVRF